MAFRGPRFARIFCFYRTTGSLLACMLRGRCRRQLALANSRQSEGLEERLLLTHVAGNDDGVECADDHGHDHQHDDGHEHGDEHEQGCCCPNCQGAGQNDDHAHMHALFAPGTSQAVVDAHHAAHDHGDEVGFAEFNADDRWFTTASDGGGIGLGDPITLTWSIAPDGTNIPGFNGEATAPSDLVSRFRGIYGDAHDPADTNYVGETWFGHIESALDRWSDISGITYVYEPNDDGASFSRSSSAAPGVVGVRGDVRIGGHLIDGNSSVLAYNFFPDNGEMVIDTADSFYTDLRDNSVRFRNVIAHEAGHGLGFSHVESNNASFLMEPFLNPTFDGPQLDDILASHRNFGDANEAGGGNDSSGVATSLGSIGDGVTVTIGQHSNDTRVEASDTDFVSIDDDSDIDVFSFTVNANSSVDINLTPQGPTYNQGRQGGTQSSYDASSQSNLSFQLLGTDGSTVLTTASTNGIGQSESITGFDLTAGGTYYVQISGADNTVQMYQLDVSAAVDVPTSTVSIEADSSTQAEGDVGTTDFTYTVTRSGDTSLIGTVEYIVAGIGADPANAADFGGSLPGGTVTFDPGILTQTITVSVSGDLDVEASEAFSVTLVSPSSGMQLGTDSATSVITNDDTSLSIAAADASKNEGDNGTTAFTFTVSRTGDVSAPGSVNWTVSGNGATPDDFANGVYPSGVLQFGSGDTTATISVDVSGDLDVEADEGFTVALSSATSGATIAAASADGTISNDDSDYAIAATNANQNEGDTGTTAFTFTVTRTGDTGSAASANWSLAGSDADAADFGGTLPSGTVNFAANQSESTITINVSGDNDVESDEGFTVTLDSVSGNGEITTASAHGVIVNDDVQIDIALAADDADKAEGDTGTTAFTFVLTRTGMTTGSSSVDFGVAGSGASAADANDFGGVLPSGTVNFAAGETQQTITILVSGDTLFEADEDFAVSLSNAINAEIVAGTASGTIRNDDIEPESFSISADTASLNEAEGTFTFTVTRSGNTSSASTVSYSVAGSGSNPADAADFGETLPSGTVSFAAGATTATITVAVTDDSDVEPNENFTVILSADGNPSASATIVNDDSSGRGVSLVDGVLTIIGDGGDDYVWARGYRRTIGVYTYSFTDGAWTWDVFNQSDVASISINTDAGNDYVYLTGRINQNSSIDLGAGDDFASGGRGSDAILGGDGNDRIYGNNGHDTIEGGAGSDVARGGRGNDIIRGGSGENWLRGDGGHDILVGGSESDYLNGGGGRDIVIGGGGSDWIDGGGADDILIGGSTIYDSDNNALSAIRSEWTARRRYDDRVNTISNGGGNLNGIKLEAGTTVLDDGDADYLIGGRGKDWFFGDSAGADRDRIFRSSRELLAQLP